MSGKRPGRSVQSSKVAPPWYVQMYWLPHQPTAPSGSREQTISRLAILKAAAAFGASRPDLKSGDVLKIAASLLEWVERVD